MWLTVLLTLYIINFEEKQKDIWIFYNFLTIEWQRLVKFFLMEDKDLFVLYSQYLGC